MGIELINIDHIHPNPDNPRKHFDEAAIAELAASIREVGILQPLLVTPVAIGDEARYRLICGERRWYAAKQAGLVQAPAIIRNDLTTAQEAEIMLIENLQRKDLDPIEEAGAYRELLIGYGYTQEKLAEKLGVSQGHIANRIRLLELPETVKENISRGIISASHGKVLAGHKNLPSPVIEKAVEIIAADNVPVSKADNMILRLVAEKGLPLFDNYRKKPEFKSGKGSECYTCEHRAMGKDMYISGGDNEQPFCLNHECWELKQQVALQKKFDKAQRAASGQDVVDTSKLNWDQYTSWMQGDTGYDQSECFDCEHRKRTVDRENRHICLDPACMKKKRSAKVRADNKVKKDAFQVELQDIAEMAKSHTDAVFYRGNGVAQLDKTALIYLAAQVLACVEQWHDRKTSLFKYLKEKYGWDHDVLKRGAWGLLNNDWDIFRQLIEKLDERQLLELIFEWPAVARGLNGAEGWFLKQMPTTRQKEEDLLARSYQDKNGHVIFVSAGLWSESGGEEYGTFWRSEAGGLHRVKSQAMPMTPSREEAQRNLDAWADKNGLQPINGDAQCNQTRTA